MSTKLALSRRLTEGDDCPEDSEATGSGILRCLEMLADEALALRMQRTLDALLEALDTCTSEMTDDEGFVNLARPRGARLH